MKEITFNKEEAKALEALVEMQIDMILSEGDDLEDDLQKDLDELQAIHYKMLKFLRFK
jgi:hypothetical protein|tara:strand:- start:1 stop:174 length:174 start_codon:yes stop_codon:yes gene_type:complete